MVRTSVASAPRALIETSTNTHATDSPISHHGLPFTFIFINFGMEPKSGIMKNLLLLPLFGLLLVSFDSIMGWDTDSLDTLIQNTTVHADSAKGTIVTQGLVMRLHNNGSITAQNEPYYIINDRIISDYNGDSSVFGNLKSSYITHIEIKRGEAAILWFQEQNITPQRERTGLIFVKTTQENWDEGFYFQRVK